jgi:hypothetical protein
MLKNTLKHQREAALFSFSWAALEEKQQNILQAGFSMSAAHTLLFIFFSPNKIIY